jgi:hypothetical protein
MDRALLAWEVEGYLVEPEALDDCGAPERALQVLQEQSGRQVPVGVARHPHHGWFVLVSMGQGPQIVWWEKEDR